MDNLKIVENDEGMFLVQRFSFDGIAETIVEVKTIVDAVEAFKFLKKLDWKEGK